MTTALPEPEDTPKPWETEERSVRHGLTAFATHVGEEFGRLRGTIELELRGVHTAIDAVEVAIVNLGRAIEQLSNREEITGRFMLDVASMAGKAEGKAEAAAASRRQRPDSDPVRSIVVNFVTLAAKHWSTWLWRVLPLVTAGGMWVAHRLGWLGK